MHAPWLTRKTKILTVTLLTLMSTMLFASGAWADTFTVTNLKDSGAGSLRSAIKGANYSAGADEIAFADNVGGTITLASPLPPITDPEGLIIDGGGDVTVSGNHAVEIIFEVTTAPDGVRYGNLTLRNLTIADSFGISAVSNLGTLTVTNSTFSGNSAPGRIGGAINNEGGRVTVTNSTFSGNEARIGGAIRSAGIITVANSTFSGNHAADSGGGIYNSPGRFESDTSTATITNSTFSGNSAAFEGGAIYRRQGEPGDARFSRVLLSNTIVADSPSGGNCASNSSFPVEDLGYNVSDDGSCDLDEASGSLSNTDPLLDPDGLQENGGPTETIALQADSPAVDLVAQGVCPPPQTDQRGVARPQGDSCDSGAFELEQDPQLADTTSPRVDTTSPAKGQTRVARATNVRATFSEEMDPASITKATFKLFRVNSDGTTTRITDAPVTLDDDGLGATLDPYGTSATRLASNTRYKAVVTTGAKDLAGNALDQNATKQDDQQKAWYFTTGG